MTTKKTALVLDTNQIIFGEKSKIDLNELYLKPYENVVGLVEKQDLTELVGIFIPEVCLNELKIHMQKKIRNEHKDFLDSINCFKSIDKIKIDVSSFNLEEHCQEIVSNKDSNINILKLPENRGDLFDKILFMALYKIPPFENGLSDKGFKDAAILLSISEFAMKTDYDKIVFFTNDSGFVNNKAGIEEMFFEENQKELIINNSRDIQGFIFSEFGLFVEFRTYLNNEFLPNVQTNIKQLRVVQITPGVLAQVTDAAINISETVLEEITDNIFSLTITFDIYYFDGKDQGVLPRGLIIKYVLQKKNATWDLAKEKVLFQDPRLI